MVAVLEEALSRQVFLVEVLLVPGYVRACLQKVAALALWPPESGARLRVIFYDAY